MDEGSISWLSQNWYLLSKACNFYEMAKLNPNMVACANNYITALPSDSMKYFINLLPHCLHSHTNNKFERFLKENVGVPGFRHWLASSPTKFFTYVTQRIDGRTDARKIGLVSTFIHYHKSW